MKKERAAEHEKLAVWLNSGGRGAQLQQIRNPLPGCYRLQLYCGPHYGAIQLSVFRCRQGQRAVIGRDEMAVKAAPPGGQLPALRRHLKGAHLTGALVQPEGGALHLLFTRGGADTVLTVLERGIVLCDAEGRVLSGTRLYRGGGTALQPELSSQYANSEDELFEQLTATGRQATVQFWEGLREQALRSQRRTIERLQRTIGKVEQDHDRFAGWETVQRQAELLKSQLWRIKRGMSAVELDDYFSEQPSPAVRVDLDRKLSPADNLERLFKRAAKYRRGLDKAEQRKEELQRQLAAAELELVSLEKLQPGDWAQLAQRSDKETRRVRSKEPVEAGQRKLWRSWRCDGALILAGRNARGNEQVTFKEGRGNDLWFHCHNWPGSHVILKGERRGMEFSERQIRAAALLALYYSRAAAHGREEVLYTSVKHVRKVPGGKPGQVTVAGGKRIVVDLQDPLLGEFIQGQSGKPR